MDRKLLDSVNRLSLKEKVAQLKQSFNGWEVYVDRGYKLTDAFYKKLEEDNTMGNIYGMLRADQWCNKDYESGIKPEESAKILNSVQKEIMKNVKIPTLFSDEIPHGLVALDATTFPVNLAVGSTFNPGLYEKMCSIIAKETRAYGSHMGLISCLDVALDPRWGRTEESYGEDTLLAMRMTERAVIGLQGNDMENIPKDKVGAVIKHFIGQGSTIAGHNGLAVNIGERELRTHHLPIMQAAIDKGAISCMAAYNDLDGIPCHANKRLLKDILIDEMGFKGFVMSDGWAVDDFGKFGTPKYKGVAMAINAGVHQDLWNSSYEHTIEAVDKGLITEEAIDFAVYKLLEAKKRLGLFDNPFADENLYGTIDWEETRAVNLNVAEEAVILLKNDGILPVKSLDNACLIGNNAFNFYHQLGGYTPLKDVPKMESIKDVMDIPYTRGSFVRTGSKEMLKEAVELAKKHETVYLTVGSTSFRDNDTKYEKNGAGIIDYSKKQDTDSGEGYDVADIELSPPQMELFNAIYKVNKNIVVIVVSGRPISLQAINDKARAILCTWYNGSEGGHAIKNTILGKNNPSGKLSISIPRHSGAIPCYYWMRGFKPYVDMEKPILYPFGYGLSYSEFSQKIVGITRKDDSSWTVAVEVENKSDIPGKWTTILFGEMQRTTGPRPINQMMAFEKNDFKANEKKILKLKVDAKWLHDNYKFEDVIFSLELEDHLKYV